MVAQTATLIPAPTRFNWTVNYSGTTHVVIPEYTNAEPITGTAYDAATATFVDLATVTDTEPPITRIANDGFTGQITNYRMGNDRHYPGLINAATMPESTVLVDVLDGGTVLIDNSVLPMAQFGAVIISDGDYSFPVNGARILYSIADLRSDFSYNISFESYDGDGSSVGLIILGDNDEQFDVGTFQNNGLININYFAGDEDSTGGGSNQFIIFRSSANPIKIRNLRVVRRTDGIITNADEFNFNQPYVPLLESNQHYLSANSDTTFTNGIDTANNMMTSAAGASNLAGSWSGNQPVVGSVLSSNNGAVVEVTAVTGDDLITYSVTTGTEDQIQLGFQYPNVLTVTPPASP